MWPVIAALHDAHHTALAPTLPGHGTSPEDLRGVRWDDWIAAAGEWPADAVVGQSLGGSLALALAATGACSAAVAINPVAPDPDALDGLEWRRSRGHEWIDAAPPLPGETTYPRVPIGALVEMSRGTLGIDLAAVTVPVLLVTSANDDVVDPASADVIAAALGGPVTRMVLPASGHVATIDTPDRALLLTAITRFVAEMT